MQHMSDRCKILRDLAVNVKPINPLIGAQWAFHFASGLTGVPPAERDNAVLTAAGIAAVIRGAPAVIQDGELIVGYNFGDTENYAGLDASTLRQSHFSEPDIDWFMTQGKAGWNLYQRRQSEPDRDVKALALNQEMAAMGFCLSGNHSVIGYEQVLRLGFTGLLRQLDAVAGDRSDQVHFKAMRLVCQAACELGDRYARKAEEQLTATETGSARGFELRRLAETCRQVPRYPARSFQEAVQSLWFAHIINTWEDGINANSLGRLDQILYPYYKADLERGLLTPGEAFELICCLWIKLYRDYDVQQSCVGGCDAEGRSAVNALSWLMLDATEALDFVRCLSVRFSADVDRPFMTRALEVVGHVQKGIPFFFNDDVMIPALVRQGIDPADANDYTQLGCVETVIPGKSNPHAVTARCNLLKAIEYSLANGRSMLSPELCPGLETGDPAAWTSFDQLKNAVLLQIRHMLEHACRMTRQSVAAAAFNDPKPYKSLLTAGCLASGRDFNDRGAQYDYYQVMLLGLPNLADSLAAVRELIFRQKRYTLTDLILQLEQDFPDELFRLDLVNKAPKFGNDLDEVDQLAVECLLYACDVLQEISDRTGFCFQAQPFTFLWMVDHGRLTAATPDGRHRGEILAYSASPMQGRDYNGFTALINSLAKLPTTRTAGTTSAIVEVDPLLFTDRNMPRFVDIMRTAAVKGISNVQFNVVDADILLDAQKHPEKHRNLAVRVSGFSQKFYLLDRTMQDHIISRTKHQSL